MNYPSQVPRPPGEEEELSRIWQSPTGWRRVTDVNNTYLGLYYIGTAILFLLLAGILALVMRVQLAAPGNDFVTAATYNQIFTMHGTVMMFLFAVPVIEAVAVYLLPQMLAARDLPFPRLSAYAFWAYFFGGTVFFCSIFWDLAPDGGWFMYPPLTSYESSPGINSDFWLLGIGFIEISAIAGAVELVVGVLRTRAPGMSLDKMPVYAWAMLVVGAMIVFGFPPVILGTMLLELERAFHWPFFIAERGGDPLLWQHLFWLFGHPEVYIIFLPAAGMVSMIVPTVAKHRLIAYRLVVLAVVGVGILSFGLWVHHMFATGLPRLSLGFFSAASMAVAIPSGIQVFAWIATLGAGRPRVTVPALFILGFLFIFTLGGITGVMVAVIPFDWQAHDSYFIVAHLHYVLIGGMVFPLFAGFYYWAPTVSGRKLSDWMGTVSFWLMFGGFNLAFFPMHIAGLMGMPRRVYTYPAGLGWELPNMLSTVGAFVFAAGVVIVIIDIALHLRISGKVDTNPWDAGTLEWLPYDDYAGRSIPRVHSREPIWDRPEIRKETDDGHWYLPRSATGLRETIVTSPAEAEPQYVMVLPGPGWPHFLAAFFTAAFFLLLTVKFVLTASVCGVLALIFILVWVWHLDQGPIVDSVDIGGGQHLPIYVTGPSSHSWWATVVIMLVLGSIFASLAFTYYFLWMGVEGAWPPEGMGLSQPSWPVLSAVLLALGSAAVALSSRLLQRGGRQAGLAVLLPMVPGVLLLVGGLVAEGWGQWQAGVRPAQHAYAAAIWTFISINGAQAFTVLVMTGLCLARAFAHKLDGVRRVTFENTMLFWHYTTAQSVASLAVVHLAPRLL
jgi:cytochrome c oxidase subunit I+III